MIAIAHYIINLGMIIGGLYMALIGFKVVKLKVKPEDQEKMDQWFQKFGSFLKIGGILTITLGIFLLVSLIFKIGD